MSRMVKKKSRLAKTAGRTKSSSAVNPESEARKTDMSAVALEDGVVNPNNGPEPQTTTPPSDLEKTEDSENEGGKIKASETQVNPAPVQTPSESETSGVHTQIAEKLELLGFLMNQEEYAIPISQVKEIIRCAEMTLIPGSSPILLGIISLRGVIVPVYKLGHKLAKLKVSGNEGDIHEENGKLKRIVIIQIDQGYFGLMVDGVTDVIKIQEQEIKPPPSLLNQMGQEMIKGITKFKNRLVILLFIERIVDVIQDEMKNIRKS